MEEGREITEEEVSSDDTHQRLSAADQDCGDFAGTKW